MRSEEKSVDAQHLYETLCLVISSAFSSKTGASNADPSTAPRTYEQFEGVLNHFLN